MAQEPAEPDPAADPAMRQHIDRVVDALEPEAAGNLDHETLTAVVEADFRRYVSSARVRDFVPVFVERDVRARLRKRYGRAPRRP